MTKRCPVAAWGISLLLVVSLATKAGANCPCDKVKVGFYTNMCADGLFQAELENSTSSGNGNGCGYYTKGSKAIAQIEPDKIYHLHVTGSKVSTIHVNFDDLPECYKLFIDGKESSTIDESSEGGCAPYQGVYSIELRSDTDGVEPGQGSGPAPGSVLWSVGLGSMNGGGSAGVIGFHEQHISAGIYTPEVLSCSERDGLIQIKNGQVLRQVLAPQALADIVVINSSQYEIRFYRPDQVGPLSSGVHDQTGKTAFVTWRFENPNGNPAIATRLKITEIRDGLTIHESEVEEDTGAQSWTFSSGGGLRQELRESSIDGVTGDRILTVTIKDQNGTVASKKTSIYHTFPWGDEIIKTIDNPDGDALETNWTYYENPAQETYYGKIDSVVYPDGSWIRREYDDYGNLAKEYKPWKDAPATPAAATEDNCHLTEYFYTSASNSVFARKLRELKESILEVEVGRKYISYGSERVNDRLVLIETEEEYKNSTVLERKIIRTYDHEEDEPYRGRIKSIQHADGRLESHDYETGEYDAVTRVFTPGEGLAKRHMVLTTSTALPEPVPFKTTRQLAVADEDDRLVFEETQVFDGNQFVQMKWTAHEHDEEGHVIQTARDGRVVYSAVWDDGQLVSETDETGIEITYQRDALDRVISQTKEGVAASGGFPAQVDVVTTFQFDAEGRVLMTTTTAGALTSQSSSSYDAAGRIVSQTNTTGQTFTTSYSNGGRTVTRTLPGGGTEITDRYIDRQLRSVTGTAVTAQYSDYSVDPQGKLVRTTWQGVVNSPAWTRVTTDWLGRVLLEEHPGFAGTVSSQYLYDGFGRLVRRTRPGLGMLISEYDDQGNLIRSGVDMNGSGALEIASDDQIQEQNSRYVLKEGNWYQAHTSRGYTITGEAASVQATSWISLFGDVSMREDGQGNMVTTRQMVDRNAKRVTRITHTPESALPALEISINGLLLSVSSHSVSHPMLYQYDALGRVLTVTDPRAGSQVTFGYNALGQATTRTDAAGVTATSYDAAGKVKSVTNPDGSTVYYSYDLRGLVTNNWGSGTYPLAYVRNNHGQVTEMRTYRGGSGWNAATWPVGSTGTADITRWHYQESTGLLLEKEDASGKKVAYTYDAAGRPNVRTWARGVATAYSYNMAGELLTVNYSDSTPDVVIVPSRRGQPLLVTDASGTRMFQYNNHGGIVSETIVGGVLGGVVFGHAYDGLGRRTQVQVQATNGSTPITHANTYAYDAYSRLASVGDGVRTVSYSYLGNSNLAGSINHQHGAASVNTARHYDVLGRLSNTRHISSAGQVVSSHGYQYDNMGRRTRAYRADGASWTYDYNDRGELVSARKQLPGPVWLAGQQFGFEFDGMGNRISAERGGDALGANLRAETYTVNGMNQYSSRTVPGAVDILGRAPSTSTVTVNSTATTRQGAYFHRELAVSNGAAPAYESVTVESVPSIGSPDTKSGKVYLEQNPEGFVYDFDGNLTTDGRWSYSWDAENRLVAMESIGAVPAAGKQRLEFTHDAQGRRISKKTWKWNVGSSSYQLTQNILFLYDGWNILAELVQPTAGVAYTRLYGWGLDLSGSLQGAGGVGGLLFSHDIGGSAPSWWYVHDGNGNVSALINSSDGTREESYDYGPFGERLGFSEAATSSNRYGFSSKYRDEETELIYYGYRYYDSSLGRWLNKDPIGESGGVNLYGMVANDPVNFWDYLGLAWDTQKGLESLQKHKEYAEAQRKGTPLTASGPCCDQEKDGNNGWPSAAKCHGFNCIEFLSSVISCGYRLNNDKKSSERVLETAGNGEKLMATLESLGWKMVFYARDIYRIEYPWATATDKRVARATIAHEILEATRYRKWNGLSLSGAVTNFDPWPSSGYYLLPANEQDPGGVQAKAYTALNSEPFGAIATTGAWHTALLSNGTVYEGSPRLASGGNTPTETVGFKAWVSKFGPSAAQVGVVAIPPDGGKTSMSAYGANLNHVNAKRPGRSKPGYSPVEIDTTPADPN